MKMKFKHGDRVKKSTGSEWVGKIVGTYSTEQTPEGYAVESEAHRGSVQIYPAKALEAWEEESLQDRMRAAGMLTVDEMLRGAPLDRFIRHAGVSDLETYGQWLDMKCREFLSMQASRDLDKREDDDLYEWVLAHAAAFQEARINFNATRPTE